MHNDLQFLQRVSIHCVGGKLHSAVYFSVKVFVQNSCVLFWFSGTAAEMLTVAEMLHLSSVKVFSQVSCNR